MAAPLNNTAIKAAYLAKLTAIAQGLSYNIAAWNANQALYNAVGLDTTDVATDVNSFYDSAVTGGTAPSDFLNYPQLNCPLLAAATANIQTWIGGISGATLGQIQILAGKSQV